MLDGFETRMVDGAGARIHCRVGGSGPPLLLLHGYPQTHVMWHRLAPVLAERWTVVAPDLRGYGDSEKPASGPDHAGYSKRAMAADQVAVMDRLGFRRFPVVGHDRGARVAHRMALDHPAAVERLAILDVCPTLDMYLGTTMAFARAYWHWFFLIQPFDLPERLIGGDPEYYLRRIFALSRRPDAFDPAALAEYLRCFRQPETIHATCEDYRAAATIDLAHDQADLSRRLECPVMALWGAHGVVGALFDPIELWRRRAHSVVGHALDCGHFLPEEAPAETLAALGPFLRG